MEKVRLGRTGLMVSEVGLGGIPIMNLNMEEGVSLVRQCFDLGITFFDTANMYGDSEKKMGAALEPVRDQVVLATKTLKRDAEGAEKHLAFSLENLKTKTIDIYVKNTGAERLDPNRTLILIDGMNVTYTYKIVGGGTNWTVGATAVFTCTNQNYSANTDHSLKVIAQYGASDRKQFRIGSLP